MSIPLISLVSAHLNPAEELNKQIAWAAQPIELPGVGELIDAHIKSRISDSQLATACQYQGVPIAYPLPLTLRSNQTQAAMLSRTWDGVYKSKLPQRSEGELNALRLREEITPAQWDSLLTTHGYKDVSIRFDKSVLLSEIPRPEAYTRYVAAQVFDWSYVTAFGLNAGFDNRVNFAYQVAGLSLPVPLGPKGASFPLSQTAAELDWYAHWQMPGEPTIQQLRIRLRPSFANPAVARDPSGLVWSSQQHAYAMRSAEVPPALVEYYDAIAFRPLPVRHLHAMFDMGLVNQTDLAESFGDEGYSPANSAQLASEVAGAHRQHLLLAQEAEAVKILTAAWLGGTIPDDVWRVGYYRSTLSNAAAVAAYDALPQATQVATAQGDGLTSGQLSLMIMERATKNAAAVVESTKRRLMESHINFGQAIQLLQNRGLTTDFIAVTTQAWAEEFNPPHKELQTGELMEALRRGWITQATAVARLQLLGWLPADIAVLLAKVGFEVSEDVVKAATLAQRQVEQQHQAALALQKQAAAAAAAAKRAMLAHGTPAELMGWAKKKIITVTQYRNAMLALGEQTDLIDANVQEIQQAIAPKPAKPARVPVVKPPPPPKPSPEPTVAEITAWVKKGIIQLPEYESRLAAKGYSTKDIADFVAAL